MSSTTLPGRGPRPTARLTRNVAPGVHRLEHADVNCYLVEGDDRAEGVTLVDTAFPATWGPLLEALEAIDRRPDEVRAVVLTHAHFDHLGMARRLSAEHGIPVWLHREDRYIAEHPYRYAHDAARLLYPIWYPGSIPILARMTRAGALMVPGVDGTRALEPGAELAVPGRPSVVFSPGHTAGHCALHLPGRDALLTGDAVVTLDPYTAETGPRVVAGAATADPELAFASLAVLEETGARRVLPGHGEPWLDGIGSAVAAAVLAGPA